MPTLLLYGRGAGWAEVLDRADDVEGIGLELCSVAAVMGGMPPNARC